MRKSLFSLVLLALSFSLQAKVENEICGVVQKIYLNNWTKAKAELDNGEVIEINLQTHFSNTVSRMRQAKLDLARDSMNFGHTFCGMKNGKNTNVGLSKSNP